MEVALRGFVEDCAASGLFTAAERVALEKLLGGGGDPVVRAAYLVAYAGGRDAKLLFAVLKDLAMKQLSADGREEHVAQEELVDMVECLVRCASSPRCSLFYSCASLVQIFKA